MSLSNETVKVTYQGNGSTTTFAITFDVIVSDTAEVEVFLRDETTPTAPIETLQVITTDYTLTGAVPPGFATDVEMIVAPTSDEKLIVRRKLPLTQTIAYTPTGPFPAEDHEEGLDRLAAQAQQNNEQLTRALLLKKTAQLGPYEIPSPIADRVIGFDNPNTTLKLFSADDLMSLAGALLITNNLSDVANVATSVANLLISPFNIQTSFAVLNNQVGAADITGFTLDATNNSSAMFAVEIDRSTASNFLFANGIIWLQRANGAWRFEKSTFNGDVSGSNSEPGGVVFTITEAGGIAQMKYETDNMAGASYVGTILFKRVVFAV